MVKSLTVAFSLWATLGLFGAHHFYLGRDRHGVVHLVTLGGFLVGWLYDAFVMRDYVQWANSDTQVHEECVEEMESRTGHSQLFLSETAHAILAHFLWSLVKGALSDSVPGCLDCFVVPFLLTLVLAYAVYFLGNIGEIEGSFWGAAKGALLTVPYYMYNPEGGTSWCLMACEYTFKQSARFRSKPEDHGNKLQRFCRILLLAGIIGSLATANTFHNCETEVPTDGPEPEIISCIDAMEMVYNVVRYNGIGFLLEHMLATDPAENAAHVLGVPEHASDYEIRTAYKKLARRYHPDKTKDPEQRLVAHRKFMEIAEAYALLLEKNAKRAEANLGDSRKRDTEL